VFLCKPVNLSNMESNIEIRLKESIAFAEDQFKTSSDILEFEKIQREFADLVKRGFTRERGNNLLSPSDSIAVSRIAFNA